MIPKKYYYELELPENASLVEIKRAYRRLVKKYHPDKNPSELAKNKFLKIQEAYEILIGERPLPFAEKKVSQADQEAQKAQEILEKVRRQKIIKEHHEKIEYLKAQKKHVQFRKGPVWNYYRFVLALSLILIALIISDSFFTKKVEQFKVITWLPEDHSTFYGKMLYNLNCEDYRVISTVEGIDIVSEGEIIFLEKTMLMQEPIQVIYRDGFRTRNYPVSNSVFSYLHMVGIFLTPLFISWLFRNNVWIFRILQQGALVIASLFLIYFLFDEIRLFRILHIVP